MNTDQPEENEECSMRFWELLCYKCFCCRSFLSDKLFVRFLPVEHTYISLPMRTSLVHYILVYRNVHCISVLINQTACALKRTESNSIRSHFNNILWYMNSEWWAFYSWGGFRTKQFYCWGFTGAALVIIVTVKDTISLLVSRSREQCTGHLLITIYDVKVSITVATIIFSTRHKFQSVWQTFSTIIRKRTTPILIQWYWRLIVVFNSLIRIHIYSCTWLWLKFKSIPQLYLRSEILFLTQLQTPKDAALLSVLVLAV